LAEFPDKASTTRRPPVIPYAGGGAPAAAKLADPTPPPPRSLTSRAKRAAWMEPHVRFWWLVALCLFIAAACEAVVETTGWNADRNLLDHGVVVNAKIGGLGHTRPPGSDLDMSFDYQGQTYDISGPLEGPERAALEGTTVAIHINPSDPTQWTSRTYMEPLIHSLLGAGLALLTGAMTLGVSALIRQRVIRIYRIGDSLPIQIVSLRTSALAPRAKLAQFTRYGWNDNDLNSVILPAAFAKTAGVGDVLWVYCLKGKRSRVLPAVAFE
jgi:hypothetical protein